MSKNILTILVALNITLFAAFSHADTTKVTIGGGPYLDIPQLSVAMDQNLWADNGIEAEVIPFRSGRAAFEAMLGTIIIIKTMSGKTIKASVKAGTQPGTYIRIPSEGMPIVRSKQKGHMFIRIDILIPSNLTQDQKEILTKYFNR